VVLVQGGAYWLLARDWVGRRPMPAGVARRYRAFRALDVALLAAGLAGVVVWLPEGPVAAATVVATWLFGALEYVNYFVVRLAYPPRRWRASVTAWRTPRLVRDLMAADGAPPPGTGTGPDADPDPGPGTG
jgi:hypothetical protein